jgi:hypothetical protein
MEDVRLVRCDWSFEAPDYTTCMTDDGERRREHRFAWSQLWWNIESLGCLQPRHMGVNSMKVLNFLGAFTNCKIR